MYSMFVLRKLYIGGEAERGAATPKRSPGGPGEGWQPHCILDICMLIACMLCHNLGEKGVHLEGKSSSSDKIFGEQVDDREASLELKARGRVRSQVWHFGLCG